MTTAPADEEQTQVNQELGSYGAFRTGDCIAWMAEMESQHHKACDGDGKKADKSVERQKRKKG